jgi:sulfoxide reductase heme-binding subunit YedZ
VSPVDRRYRYVYKPLVFAACLVPLAWAVAGVVAGTGLGADPVRRVLGIFGKTTLNLLGITLCVTPLRVLSGNANLLRLRRMLGVYAFVYALLHFLVYIGPFQGFSWAAIVKDLTKRPYIMVGFSALLMLAALAATSTNGMMRRLKRRWQQLHRLIYAAAAFGVWHYWWQVKKDVREPLLYAGMLALLLGWRLWRRRAR